MILDISFEKQVKDAVFIDFIELRLANGNEIALSWDSSMYDFSSHEHHVEARMSGVCFDEEYANGRIHELEGASVTAVQIYGGDWIELSEMVFDDNGTTLVLPISENYEILVEG